MTNKEIIIESFESEFKSKLESIEQLPASGSSREYYRVNGPGKSIIATVSTDRRENNAFVYLAEHFKSLNINVPKIISTNLNRNLYFQDDLGDLTLYDFIKNKKVFDTEVIDIYKRVIDKLIEIQFKGASDLDFSNCYPRSKFDEQSMSWDLNYYKYFFLKLSGIQFDEQLLENDFKEFIEYLMTADTSYFLYRDFQSSNIMLFKDDIYLIDFQGGREGAYYYDLASLLYDSKAGIPTEIRLLLKDYYKESIHQKYKVDISKFEEYYSSYALIRVLQAMGAYGYRGFFERKSQFLQSIPGALVNLSEIIQTGSFEINIPELFRVLTLLPESEKIKSINLKPKLKVMVQSFSYKRGIPYDSTGHGGGLVFDCRFLDNPGRIEGYKQLCGKDFDVIKFLEDKGEVQVFLKSIFDILDMTVGKYINRNFENLSVNFGCTGGRHRSVYCAEKTTEFLKSKYDIKIVLEHKEGF